MCVCVPLIWCVVCLHSCVCVYVKTGLSSFVFYHRKTKKEKTLFSPTPSSVVISYIYRYLVIVGICLALSDWMQFKKRWSLVGLPRSLVFCSCAVWCGRVWPPTPLLCSETGDHSALTLSGRKRRTERKTERKKEKQKNREEWKWAFTSLWISD